jgi:hypothetical protein
LIKGEFLRNVSKYNINRHHQRRPYGSGHDAYRH